jgi:ribonuclease R
MKKENFAKLYEYLAINSGSEVNLKDLIDKFTIKKVEKKKRREPIVDKIDSFLEFLKLLENEGLLKISKKIVTISRPFHLIGKISLSKRGDGFVRLTSGSEVFVPSELTGGAISGDKVELLPLRIGKKDRLEGEVREIVLRGRHLYRMRVDEADGNYFYGKLLDMQGEVKEGALRKKTLLADVIKSIKPEDVIIIKLKDKAYYDNNIYEVSFVKFETGSTRDLDLNRILMKYNFIQTYPDHIHTDNFSEEVNESTISDWNERVDVRDLYTVTIDGANSKDFDDAISLHESDGITKLYVHIADVSAYVKQGSPLDEEAYHRATSVYLTDTVVPMLPPILSEDLCSLVADKNRLAFTVEMVVDYSGHIHSSKFYKSIIKVNKRLTYEIAQEEILENHQDNFLVKLMKIANALKADRISKGRVELNLKEVYIQTKENGEVIDFKWRERLDSHILIEELMLSANVKVAEFLRKKNAPALFRIHETMDEEKLETLNSFLSLYGVNHVIKSTDYEELKMALLKIHGNPAEKIFNYFLLRSFMQAYYSGEKLGHWGLGFKDYCHFTSPIRRYPDLVVHRVLDSLLKGESELPYSTNDITEMGVHTSDEERKAADAERDIQKIKACRYIDKLGIKEFVGIISGIKPQMIFVELEGYFGEGAISYVHFTEDYELKLPNDFSFISKKYAKTFFLGQKIDLELEKIDYEEMKIFLKPKIKAF